MGKCAFFGENEKDYEKDYYRAAKYDIFIVEDDIICIFNSRKTWMSAKNNEKLNKICEQERDRAEFLESVKRLLF